jgi:hypothetical protein
MKQLSSTPGEKLFTVSVYVDDYWTYCEDDAAYDAFFQRWSARYTASASLSGASHDFCGNTYTRHDDGSISLGCGKLMASMDLLLEPHGLTPDVYETPMVADALTHLREPPSDSNPLVDQIPAARAILGLGLYIARGTRTDTLLPALALSQYIVTNLTTYVWGALLR